MLAHVSSIEQKKLISSTPKHPHRAPSRLVKTPNASFLDTVTNLLNPSALLNAAPGKKERRREIAPGIAVGPMGLGTWSWGNQFLWGYNEQMDGELQEVFNLAVSQGVNLFDTADSYGTGKLNGKSELLLGEFSKSYPGPQRVRDDIHIATKFASYPWRILPGSVVSACKASAERLGVDSISLGQLHWSTANYGPRELSKFKAYLDKRGVPLATAQIQYSLLSCGKEQADTKALCDDLGITLIAYSPLALGLLTGKYSLEDKASLPSGPRGQLFRSLLPKVQPLLDTLQAIAASRNKNMSQVAINWCICKGTIPIPGAKTLNQAQSNLGALGWRLSASEVAELDNVSASLGTGTIQNIFQTK
ncbi:NADP-dependent oxidoreductase domain-containing protein [Dunaliella salina]|uniref:NADP-dependent oxidoreductase domain-containing protein n=1 Tax=Dunaliella salina TaxID=3046 RepID=A0ABQ7GMH5_DUNSA|nr:NADP-dependent oxidoreductase domain-containing protein [Dunaliella salina]|eukprot:KAF5835808.1 NADP-dependent oxidoreductase domain-containing protein [Dunaliella salina]